MNLQKVIMKVPFGEDKGQLKYTLKHVNYGNVSYRTILEEISDGSTFSVGDADAVLKNFFEMVVDQVADGHTVEMGELGTLKPKIQAKCVDTRNECTASTIKRVGMQYTPSMTLEAEAKAMSMRVVYFGASAFDEVLPDGSEPDDGDDTPGQGDNDSGSTEPGGNTPGGGSQGGGDLEG